MDENKISMEQRRANVIALIKSKLEKCGGNYEYDESITIVGEHGDHAGTKHIYLDNGKIYAHIYNAWMEEPHAFIENGLSSESLALISNSITCPDPKDEVVNEIVSKLFVQPEMPYAFDELFEVTLEDGNTFGVERIEMDDNGILTIALYKDYTDTFEVGVEELTEESLQIISDEIRPPRDLRVMMMGGGNGFLVKHEYVMWNTTEEQMLQKLKEWFPAFNWQHDDEEQFVHYPNKDDDSVYFLANFTD